MIFLRDFVILPSGFHWTKETGMVLLRRFILSENEMTDGKKSHFCQCFFYLMMIIFPSIKLEATRTFVDIHRWLIFFLAYEATSSNNA